VVDFTTWRRGPTSRLVSVKTSFAHSPHRVWKTLYLTMATTAAPNLNLTAEEKRVFFQLFQAADTDKLGVITGEVAVKFFEKTKLPPPTLGEVRDKKPAPASVGC
jgi:hypothetical protein